MTSGAAPCQTERTTGMARSILAEVARLLDALAGDGSTGSIDLRSLPLSDADRRQLEQALGRGEVVAELELAGRSTVWETAYAGVWWIRHRGAGDAVSSEEIAICRVPEILQAHEADIESAVQRLKNELKTIAAFAAPTGSVAAEVAQENETIAAFAAPTGSVAAEAAREDEPIAAFAAPTEPEADHG